MDKEVSVVSEKNPLKVTHQGKWKISDDIDIDCYVTENKVRMLSLRGTARAMNLKGGGSGALLRNLNSQWIQPYLSDHLKEWISWASKEEITKINGVKGSAFIPFEATLFVDVCKAYVQAKNNGILKNPVQSQIADRLLLIMSAFAKVGIIAIIDEMTGYQEVRERDALQKILDKFLKKEFAAWAKTFPDEFYRQIFRLKGWEYNPASVRRPGVVGRYTNDLIYERLAPEILTELENLNPKTEKGYRKQKHHQWLTDDIGHPRLREHLYAVMGMMRAFPTWNSFYNTMNKAYPKKRDRSKFCVNRVK
jgi:hypothetical protein